MTLVRETNGMAIATFLESEEDGRATAAVTQLALGISEEQFKSGIQWFRRYGGVTLGYTITCDDAVDEYVLCDEFGRPVKGEGLLGYDIHLNKGIASRSMTALAVSITGYNRAYIENDILASTMMKRRVRGFWDVLESYADAADQTGDSKERDRIEEFLGTLVRP